jgi:cell division septum initiation protein DivIVA
MEDQTAILSGSLQADPFETQMRGYNRRQVDDYITRTSEQLAGLEARLGAAVDAAERARLEVAAVREQNEQHQAQAAVRPAHEEVSERLSQILRLAAEEAEQERSDAEGEIARMREQAGAAAAGILAGAQAEADGVLASAREEAESELAHARDEAQRLLASSTAESEATLIEAKGHAERLRSQAERRAAAINGVLDQRLAALTEAHGGAVSRLAELRDTISGMLVADAEAGAIAADVSPLQPAELAALENADTADESSPAVVGADPEGIDPVGLAVEGPAVEGLAVEGPDVEGLAVEGLAVEPEAGSADDAQPPATVDLTGTAPQVGPAQADDQPQPAGR